MFAWAALDGDRKGFTHLKDEYEKDRNEAAGSARKLQDVFCLRMHKVTLRPLDSLIEGAGITCCMQLSVVSPDDRVKFRRVHPPFYGQA
jgi:hypothetical protein